MYKLNLLDKISFILIIVGSLVWGIYGITGANIVNILLGSISPVLEIATYIAIGLAGLNSLFFFLQLVKNSTFSK